ncbi:MAG: transcription-repair coupling factor [Chitinophagales bacterium]
MNLQELLEQYKSDQRLKTLVETTSEGNSNVHIKGLTGSADAVIASAVYQMTPRQHLFILPDKEEAAYFQNALQSLLQRKDVFFFPDSFKKPGKFHAINSNNILLRTEMVNKISHSENKGEVMVTYSEALFEKVVRKETLQKNIVKIKLGEQLDVDFLIDVFIEYGFERVDFVFEPGQFSVRGDIVDIFSFGNEYPYRIELFGEEIESIRLFEPNNQLSTRKISSVSIVPNIQTRFENEEKSSLFDALPKDTVLWIKDANFTKEVLDNCFENAVEKFREISEEDYETEEEEDLSNFFEKEPAETFERAVDFLSNLKKFPLVEFGNQSHLNAQKTFVWNTQPQPAFNKNFDLLIEDLNKNNKADIRNFIFAENPKQIERFYSIFEDLKAEVEFYPIPVAIHNGFIDFDLKVACYTDHQIFDRYHKYKVKEGFSKDQALLLRQLKSLQPGDFVTHIDHGVGTYSGLEKIEVNGQMQEAVRLVYRDNDLLYVNINSLHKISKYVGKEGTKPKINKLGSDAWEQVKRKTKRKIKDIAEDLIKLYAKRKASKGFAFNPDTYLQSELEASFIYEDTPDQEKATADVKADMEKEYPMDRLVCGDVGFGKTEIAIRAAAKAVADGKQVAVLAPTTILTLQHYKTFRDRLENFPAKVALLNRFKSAGQKKETLNELKGGKVDILIGTHAIVGKQVDFKDLGLLIIDEEQKFGVAVKEKLKTVKANVDTLTLTATPIPRTMQFSIMNARDLSVIRTPPLNRQPIQTELHVYNDHIVKEAIEYEIYRGGQAFFIHNRVKDIKDITAMLKRLCPNIDFGIAHGQMDGKSLESTMLRFEQREFDVLVCTNIIESGVDIPNVNTIIINNAHWFGLSDLHQLRGRVGRSNKKAFCHLFCPPLSSLSSESRRRLRTIEEFSDLGSGFNIAMRDLDIRGAGNLLGGEQSGFISEIGYDMYHKILDEAVVELKQNEFKELFKEELENEHQFVRDCQIDTDLEMLIPSDYINKVDERLKIYTDLDNIENEEALLKFRDQLIDRFGPLPKEVAELMNGLRLRWTAKRLGFERIVFKGRKLKCYFLQNQDSYYYQTEIFSSVLRYVREHPKNLNLKQSKKFLMLNIENIKSMREAKEQLNSIEEFMKKEVV